MTLLSTSSCWPQKAELGCRRLSPGTTHNLAVAAEGEVTPLRDREAAYLVTTGSSPLRQDGRSLEAELAVSSGHALAVFLLVPSTACTYLTTPGLRFRGLPRTMIGWRRNRAA
jgi:hypothetical protein